jgi:hypothetical protein
MANSDRPRGFHPYGPVKDTVVAVAASAVIEGEFVTMANTGKVAAAAAAGDIYGLALSTAAAGGNVLISCDPEQKYVGQANEDDIDAQTDVGQSVDILATAENSTYNCARMEIDSTSIGASQQLLILGIEPRVGNALGEFVDVLCKINQHQAFGEDDFAGV